MKPSELKELLPNASEELVALNCQEKPDSSARSHQTGKGQHRTPQPVTDTATEGAGRKATARTSRGHPHEDLVNQYVDLLHTYGYRVAGFRPAMTAKGYRTPCLADAAGFPDLVAFRESDGRRVAIEVKIPPDDLKPEQLDWGRVLQYCKVEWYCVRPNSWDLMKDVLR